MGKRKSASKSVKKHLGNRKYQGIYMPRHPRLLGDNNVIIFGLRCRIFMSKDKICGCGRQEPVRTISPGRSIGHGKVREKSGN